jgi:hypothetical protein
MLSPLNRTSAHPDVVAAYGIQRLPRGCCRAYKPDSDCDNADERHLRNEPPIAARFARNAPRHMVSKMSSKAARLLTCLVIHEETKMTCAHARNQTAAVADAFFVRS